MKRVGVDRTTRWTLCIVVTTIVLSLGLSLIGARTFLRSDTVLRWAPWNESQPIDLELTSIPVADPVDSGFPAQELFHRRLLEGDLGTWNPYPAGGTPLASMPHQGFFDPLNLPFLLFPDRMAPAWVKLAELSVAILGVVLLLRNLGVSKAASLVAGFIYSFSGFQTVWTNWPQTHVGAYLPWLLWASERLLRKRDLLSAVAIAVATSVMLLAGFPAVTGWGVALMLVWVVLRSRTEFKDKGGTLRLLASAFASVLLGMGLTAWQILPFWHQMSATDLSHRAQTSSDHLSSSLMATAAIPTAFGSHAQGFFYGDRNYIESCAFLGAGALVVALCALLWRQPSSVSRSVTAVITALLGSVTVLIFFGGPVLALAQQFPIFDSNFVGRMRSIWLLLLSLLVGLGLHALGSVSESRGVNREFRDRRLRISGIVIATLIASFGVFYVLRKANQEGHLKPVLLAVLLAVGASAVVITAVVLQRKGYLQKIFPVLVAGVAAIEILFFVSPFWPQEFPERHYPETPAHDFLRENAGDERIATHDLAFYPGTTTHYGIRTLTGHVFHQPTWRDMLVAIDPEAFDRSYTFSFLEFMDVNRLDSPVLDRMAVKWLVTQVDFPLPGSPFVMNTEDFESSMAPGNSFVASMTARPLRGIEIELTEDLYTSDTKGRLRVEVVAPDGSVTTGRRHVRGFLPKGKHWIPVAAEDLSLGGTAEVRIRLDAFDGALKLRTNEAGAPVLSGMAPSGDNLRLAYADDVAIWRNQNALNRIRFASESIVVPDGQERVALLQAQLPPEVVILSEQSSHLTNPAETGAVIREVRDASDHMDIVVESDGPGWLVVADALQNGWQASVNGVPTSLFHADHALVAVAIPEGNSVVSLSYKPPGLKAGLTISGLSLIVVVVLLASGFRNKRFDHSSGRRSSSGLL